MQLVAGLMMWWIGCGSLSVCSTAIPSLRRDRCLPLPPCSSSIEILMAQGAVASLTLSFFLLVFFVGAFLSSQLGTNSLNT